MSTSTCYNNIGSNIVSTRYNQAKTIRSRVAESLQSNEQQQNTKPLKPILKPSTVTKMRYLHPSTSSSLLPVTTNSKKKPTIAEKNTSRCAPKSNNLITKDTKVPKQKSTATTESRKMALSKQSSSPSLIPPSSIPKVAPKGGSKSTPTKPASLQSLKAKFAAKSKIDNSSNIQKVNSPSVEKKQEELPLPWQDYTAKKKEQPACVAEPNDYDKMIQELSVSHAMVAASSFETMCFVEADQLNKKLGDTQRRMDSLYERIRLQTDTQRSTATSLKLNYVSLPMVSNFIDEVCQTSEDTTLLIDELYFTSQHAHRTETRYLRHIAGTLATMLSSRQSNQKEHLNDCCTEREDDSPFLTATLNKLESVLLDVDDGQQQVKSKSSSVASTCSSSSNSTASTVYSGFTSVTSVDTAATTSTESTSTTTTEIHRRINTMIDKISNQLQQKQQRIRLFEIQSATQEELARQRERSASLVLALEQNRSQRLTLAKQQEKEISTLKVQLLQETSKRQVLQERVAVLQGENIELKKELQKELVAAKDSCHLQIEQLHDQWDKEKELQKALEDKTKIEQSILKACRQVINNEAWHEEMDAGTAVARVIQQLKQAEDALVHQDPKFKGPKKQQELVHDDTKQTTAPSSDYEQLQLAFEQAQQAYTARESAYILQTASVEAELERILKEYDRLTRNIVDFNLERKRFEDEIRALQQEKQRLIQKVCDQRVCSLSEEKGLRKEFRKLMASVKGNHAQALMAELDRRLQLEQELRDVKSDNEMKRWEKVDVAVQTNFVPLLTFPKSKD